MFKTDWIEHLHKFRERELAIAFKGIDKKFDRGLELGAGDGFQSKLLIKYIDNLIATDLNEERLPSSSEHSKIQYKVLDAEEVGSNFEENSFDVVFSSNLMEHLPNVRDCFVGIHKILKDDGIAIHIMPSPGWRFFGVLLHFPNKLAIGLNKIFKKEKGETKKGNNLKVNRSKKSRLNRFFIPKPHGISKNFIQEFFAFRKSKWISDFKASGFDIVKIGKGPVSSGYGFGWDGLRAILEKTGVATEYIYYVKKNPEFDSKIIEE